MGYAGNCSAEISSIIDMYGDYKSNKKSIDLVVSEMQFVEYEKKQMKFMLNLWNKLTGLSLHEFPFIKATALILFCISIYNLMLQLKILYYQSIMLKHQPVSEVLQEPHQEACHILPSL